MYIYTLQTMPGCKAKFDGDTSVQYRVRRKQTSTSASHRGSTDVIRTDMDYADASALVEGFNDKEREARAMKNREDSRLAQNA